ncbi:hypothetical protein T484DRAFT_2711171 [Baffinella frigidus]|nr:hypothetical protein T484DRAFT_2711171 [Cryptophyta sp. CCMP2293]
MTARLVCILGCAGVAAAFVPSFVGPVGPLAPALGRNRVGATSPRGLVVRTATMVAGTEESDSGGMGARGLGEWFGGLLQGKDRAESDQKVRREECKRRLAAAVALNQGSANRQRVEELLEELIEIGGTPGAEKQDLTGRWVLSWSSQTADANPLSAPLPKP